MRLKKALFSYSATSFYSQIYTAWQILIEFSYSLIPVGCRAILMSCLSFESQKTYPGEFLRPEVILSRSYLRKCSIWLLKNYQYMLKIFHDAHKNLSSPPGPSYILNVRSLIKININVLLVIISGGSYISKMFYISVTYHVRFSKILKIFLSIFSFAKTKTVKGDRCLVPRYARNWLWLFDIKSQEDKS